MSLVKQMSWYTVGNIFSLFFQWLIIMLIPKITDFSEAGIFAVAISVASIVNQVATFSLYQYQVVDRYERFSRNCYAATRLTTIILSFACIIPISLLFNYDVNQISIIIAYSVYRNLINYVYLHISSLQLINRLDYVGKVMLIEGMLSFVSFIGSYYVTSNLFVATALMSIIGGFSFFMLMILGHRSIAGYYFCPRPKVNRDVLGLIRIGAILMVSTTAPIIITALPKLLLEGYWGDEAAGIFSTLTAPTIVIPTVVISLFTPLIVYFSDLAKDRRIERIRVQYSKMVAFLIAMAVAGYIVSYYLAGPVFEMLYGDDIKEYVHLFDILVVGIVAYSIGMWGITVLIAKKQIRYAGLGSFASLLISTVIMFSSTTEYGIEGAVYGLLLSYFVFGLIISVFVYLPLGKKKGTETDMMS